MWVNFLRRLKVILAMCLLSPVEFREWVEIEEWRKKSGPFA
jgi:hypothetical protein